MTCSFLISESVKENRISLILPVRLTDLSFYSIFWNRFIGVVVFSCPGTITAEIVDLLANLYDLGNGGFPLILEADIALSTVNSKELYLRNSNYFYRADSKL